MALHLCLSQALLLLCLLVLIHCQSFDSFFRRQSNNSAKYATTGVSNISSDRYAVDPFGGSNIDKALQEVIGDKFPTPISSKQQQSGSSIIPSRTAEEIKIENDFYRQQQRHVDHGSSSGGSSGVEVTLRSSLRFRCRDYLACEYHLPIIELENVVIDRGVIYLNDPDKESLLAMERMLDPAVMFKVTKGRLPSTLIQNNADNEWIPGPQIVTYSAAAAAAKASRSKGGSGNGGGETGPVRCRRVWNTNAYFLFPWEAHNAFHSLNDNVSIRAI